MRHSNYHFEVPRHLASDGRRDGGQKVVIHFVGRRAHDTQEARLEVCWGSAKGLQIIDS